MMKNIKKSAYGPVLPPAPKPVPPKPVPSPAPPAPPAPKPPTLIKVFVPSTFKLPGIKTSLSQFLDGLQQAFNAWTKVCNVQWQLVQSVPYSVNFTLVNDPSFVANVTGLSRGRGTINISTAPNKAVQWDTHTNMSYLLIIHELGHILGLGDWEDGKHPNSIMNWGTRPSGPGPEDILSVQKIWGKPQGVK